MQPYLATARAYRWILATMLVVVWGAGLLAALVEYRGTYQSEATIWTVRAAPALSVTDPDDPSIALIQTAAAQQAEVLKQLLLTHSFLVDVVGRTPLRASFEAAADPDRFIDDVRKRFRVETLGTSLIRVSFAARDPKIPPEMVKAALVVRAERLEQARQLSSASLGLLFQRQLDFAQQQAQEAQKALDDFNQTHREPLSEPDQHVRGQLRLNLDFALVRLSDLQGRKDRSQLAPALLEVSGVEFQIVDEPRVATTPRGGERGAATIAVVALVAGAALGSLLVLIATLLGKRAPHARASAADRPRAEPIASVVASSSTAHR
jgi:uncharacterized protein involved in exopolysaccharide biosynthesis